MHANKLFGTLGLAGLALGLAASVGCDYEAPRSDSYGEDPPNNVITGEVVLAVPVEQLGHVVLLATDAANPGPPEGTGFPYTLTTVPPSAFSENTSGLQSANFAITDLPDGDWIISGFMDVDNDFHPLFGPAGGATCGDVLGAHINDLTSQEIVPVTVGGGSRVDNVAVTLGIQLATERPAFTIETSLSPDGSSANGPNIDRENDSPFPQSFRLQATAIHAAVAPGFEYHLEGPFDPTAPAACQTGILVTMIDADGDGRADDHPDLPPGQGVLDIWPRIYLQYLGTSQNEDGSWNNDLDDDESWAGLAVYSPLAVGELNAIAAVDGIDNDADGQVDEQGEPLLNTPVVLPGIDVIWIPAGIFFEGDEQTVEFDPTRLPAGAWDINVIQQSGQTWSMPNGLAASTSLDEASFDPARQGETLIIE